MWSLKLNSAFFLSETAHKMVWQSQRVAGVFIGGLLSRISTNTVHRLKKDNPKTRNLGMNFFEYETLNIKINFPVFFGEKRKM